MSFKPFNLCVVISDFSLSSFLETLPVANLTGLGQYTMDVLYSEMGVADYLMASQCVTQQSPFTTNGVNNGEFMF